MVAVTAERRIEGQGTPETEWLEWLAHCPVPALPWPGQDTPQARASRLVVVAPHPDDEVLMCGGMLSLQAALGGPMHLVAVTDGEASHALTDATARHQLARARRDERLNGLAQLSVHPSCLQSLGLPDGQVAAHEADLLAALSRLLGPDDVVVCTWQLDGHPDHEACGRATAASCLATGALLLEAPVWMWHWAQPLDLRVPWERLRRLSLPLSAQAAKITALAQHRSQLAPRSAELGPVLGSHIQDRAHRVAEYFLVAAS
ncbi:MAG: PIG-L family deacetylase [Pseudomonadota bacterium]